MREDLSVYALVAYIEDRWHAILMGPEERGGKLSQAWNRLFAGGFRMDMDVLDWFRDEGQQYQVLINKVLRGYMEAQRIPTKGQG